MLNLKQQLNQLPEYELLKAKHLPRIISELLSQSRVILSPLDEIPNIAPGSIDFLFIDDAHLVSEPEIYQALRLYPKRVIIAGNYIPAFKQELVSNGQYL